VGLLFLFIFLYYNLTGNHLRSVAITRKRRAELVYII